MGTLSTVHEYREPERRGVAWRFDFINFLRKHFVKSRVYTHSTNPLANFIR